MCHIYIYLYTRTHMHTLSCRPHSLLCCCMRAPELTVSMVTAPHPQHTLNTRTPKVHTGAFSEQAFYLVSKPYHRSLHSCSLSISISDIQTHTGFNMYCSDCFVAGTVLLYSHDYTHFKIEVRVIHKALFFQILLSHFVGFKTFLEHHYFCVSLLDLLAFL